MLYALPVITMYVIYFHLPGAKACLSVFFEHPITGSQSSFLHSGRHLPAHFSPNLPRGQDLQFLPKNPCKQATHKNSIWRYYKHIHV